MLASSIPNCVTKKSSSLLGRTARFSSSLGMVMWFFGEILLFDIISVPKSVHINRIWSICRLFGQMVCIWSIFKKIKEPWHIWQFLFHKLKQKVKELLWKNYFPIPHTSREKSKKLYLCSGQGDSKSMAFNSKSVAMGFQKHGNQIPKAWHAMLF